jgi:hypothetical protein
MSYPKPGILLEALLTNHLMKQMLAELWLQLEQEVHH